MRVTHGSNSVITSTRFQAGKLVRKFLWRLSKNRSTNARRTTGNRDSSLAIRGSAARLWEKKRSSSRNWASKVLPTRQCRAFSAATRAICGSRYVSSSIALVRQKVRALPLYAPRSACSVIDFNDAQPYSSVIRAWCAKSFRSIRPYWASYWVALSLLLSFYLALLSTIEF